MTLPPLSPELLALVLAALVLDLWLGDPRWLPHPVVGMGRLIGALEARLNRGRPQARRAKGVVLTLVVVGLAWMLATLAIGFAGVVSPWLALVVEGLLLWTCLACRGLAQAARAVATPLARGDLYQARRAVSAIVGRDTRALDEAGVSRACVESVAENTVDGITAPLFWALLGGAPLALAYKAANTLDSMVGHRSDRYREFGWASARFDDLVNLLPARLTALAMWCLAAVVPGLRRRGAWSATCRQAPAHPSPNAGWPEAMVANLLGVELGGVNRYGDQISDRARLGTPTETLKARHIDAAIRCLYAGTAGVLTLLALIILVLEAVR